ncbi:MAG: murein biosynthesis integral membrane protein MurJ [Acidobacteria bacterium]|nr:murein biosynthesis integral membrane protein MurJ [Acidobacteriota bacterium]
MKPSEPAAPAPAPVSSSPPTGAPRGGLARSASIVGLATMSSRLLGLARDSTLAFIFGAGNVMDAFYVAFRLPNLLRDLFAEGTMSAAFVPTFTRRLTQEGREPAWALGRQLISALIVITGVVVLAGILLAEPLTRLLAEDFGAVPGKLELTVSLARVMLPFLTLVAVAAACMGMLNSLNRFFMPALSPAMFNVSVIICAFLLVPLMPGLGLAPIMAIAVGVLVGGLGQIAVQYAALRREGFRYRPALDLQDPGLRTILRLMGPGTVAGAAAQVNLLVNTYLAAGEGTGAVTWLALSFRLMYLPIGVLGVSIATAALPVLSRQAARDEFAGMRSTVSQGLRLMLVLMVPATVGLIVLAEPIVQLIFERGQFTSLDTRGTALALACYAPGIIGYSAVRLTVPTFYALGTSLTPAYVSIGSMALNVVLNLALVQALGYQGLALGTAIAALANATMLLVLLRPRLGGLDGAALGTCLAKIGVASGVMGFVIRAAHIWATSRWPDPGFVTIAVTLGAEITLGIGVLAAMAAVLRLAEFKKALLQITRRRQR